MISNIIDDRTKPYRWRRVEARVEASHHDNSCPDADYADPDEFAEPTLYEEKLGVSVAEALEWAASFPDRVTLYLQDFEGGPEA